MDVHPGKVKITKTPRPPKREPDEGRTGGTWDERWHK
jgi:hypothetical protein